VSEGAAAEEAKEEAKEEEEAERRPGGIQAKNKNPTQ